MAYKCVHCSAIYYDGSRETLSGCTCGSKFFFYIKQEKLKEIEQAIASEPELTIQEKKQMEADVREITGVNEESKPIFLDFESVKVMKPGKYLLDLTKLFNKDKPQVYHLEDGKYIIDLSATNKTTKV